MDVLWWQLPGPSRFLDRLDRDLIAGRNIVLPLPNGAVPDLREAVADRVHRDGLRSWRSLALNDVERAIAPARLLAEYYATPSGPNLAPVSAASLARNSTFSGLVVWVEGVTAERWPAWLRFLVEYESACRVPGEHGLLCVPLPGELVRQQPSADQALAIRAWRGQVDRLDMALYLAHILPQVGLSHLHRRLAVAVGVELAGTDPALARVLANDNSRWYTEPASVLASDATRRGWVNAVDCEWHQGRSDDFEGVCHVHSAALAARGEWAEITRRLWLGQVGALFPFLEQQRARLIGCLHPWLRPMNTDYGQQREVRDLELGHVLYQIRCAKGVSRAARREVERFKEMRDALAHLTPVQGNLLFCPEVLAQCRPSALTGA